MNSQASRVAVVNQVSRQLIHSGHPSEKEIKARQDKLNTRLEQFLLFFWVLSFLCSLQFLQFIGFLLFLWFLR